METRASRPSPLLPCPIPPSCFPHSPFALAAANHGCAVIHDRFSLLVVFLDMNRAAARTTHGHYSADFPLHGPTCSTVSRPSCSEECSVKPSADGKTMSSPTGAVCQSVGGVPGPGNFQRLSGRIIRLGNRPSLLTQNFPSEK